MHSRSSTYRVRTRPLQATPSAVSDYVAYGLALVPVLIHLWMVNRYAVNMPYLDDYTFVLDQLHLQAVPWTVREVFRVLFFPHGEHVIVFARLTAILDYWIEGTLNFRTLFFVGNATLLGTVGLLYRVARQGGLSPWLILPVPWLLFQPQYYENTMTWAICALQHIPALFFTFWAFYLLTRSSTARFALGLPVAFLATFSNGNGLAVLLTGFLVVGLQPRPGRWLTWGLFALASGGLYFYVAHLFPTTSVTTGGITLIRLARVIFDFFLIGGSMGLLFTRSLVGLCGLGLLLTLFFGAVATTGLLILTGRRRWIQQLPVGWQRLFRTGVAGETESPAVRSATICLMANYAYLLITVAGIAFARGHGWHQALLVPRFIWFATVAVAVGYLLVLFWLRPAYQPAVGGSVLLLAGLFNGMAYWSQVSELRTVRQSQMADWANWRTSRRLVTMPAGNPTYDRYYADVLEQAVMKGVYRLPDPLFNPRAEPSASVGRLIVTDSTYRFDRRPCRYVVLSEAALPADAERDPGAYLLLRSDRQTLVWPVDQSRTKLSQYLQTGRSNWDRAFAVVFADMLPPARYRLGLAYVRNHRWVLVDSSQNLVVE